MATNDIVDSKLKSSTLFLDVSKSLKIFWKMTILNIQIQNFP